MSGREATNGPPAGRARILVIDDEDAICFAFERYFTKRGHAVATAGMAARGLALCREQPPDLAFVDVRLPDGSGLDLLPALREVAPACGFVVITAFGSLEAVTHAIREKAFEYLVKPLDLDRANVLVEQFLHSRQTAPPAADVPPDGAHDEPQLIGRSPAIQEVFKAIGRAAATDSAVLITGPTGTGKELVARKIHQLSRRATAPLVVVNCGALPANLVESELFGYVKGAFTGADRDKLGRFEMAEGGTLFLDEIGDLPAEAQVKLLRFLDGQVVERLGSVTPIQLDVRILAATNRDLGASLAPGAFRTDLFYRLAVIEIRLPPLSARPEDILPLATHFAAAAGAGAPKQVSPQAAALLQACPWPGNVRQLRNAIAHALAMCSGDVILPLHLPASVLGNAPASGTAPATEALNRYLALADSSAEAYQRVLEPLERALLAKVLAETDGNQSEAAARLGIHRNTLRRRLQELGL